MSVFVFDADDTLWMNEWQYSKAYADFFSYIYQIFGSRAPNLNYVKDRFSEIEGILFPQWGVRRGRVAEAMAQSYRELCQWIEWRHGENEYLEENECHVRVIGDQPFDYSKLEWLPRAREVLNTLKEAGHRLCLLTSYDREVFPGKASFLGVHEFFAPDNILVVEGKKAKEHFVDVSDWEEGTASCTKWYAVGNGESDILPALTIAESWRGIYIPHGSTSKFFRNDGQNLFAPPPLEHPRVTTIQRIEDLLTITPDL